MTCDCLATPKEVQFNAWLHLNFQDERNDARFRELLATFPRATERRADRLLRSMPLHEDAPNIFLPQVDLWTPPQQIVFGNELAMRWELLKFAGLSGFRAASTAERSSAPDAPCAECTEEKCGPDVEYEVIAAVHKTQRTFGGWLPPLKQWACEALISTKKTARGEIMAGVAWDIFELHSREWLIPFRPECAAPPNCQNTVQVRGRCYYAGSVNYVIFGVMCKLCKDYWGWNPRGLLYTESAMLALIAAYKGPIPGKRKASGNYVPSKQWASAGYNGWPGKGGEPPADRPACAPKCSQKYEGERFRVNWHLQAPTEQIGNTF